MGSGEYRKFPSKSFCLKLPKQFVGGPFTLSLVSGIENVYASEGYVTIFRGILLSHSTETFRRGTFLCCVSENFRSRKSLWKRSGWGAYRYFPSNNFCLKVPKHFVEEPFSAVYQKIAGNEKVYGKKGEGGVSKYSVGKNFSQIAETFRRGTLYSFISFGYRNCLCIRGLCHSFPWIFFVSQYRTIS